MFQVQLIITYIPPEKFQRNLTVNFVPQIPAQHRVPKKELRWQVPNFTRNTVSRSAAVLRWETMRCSSGGGISLECSRGCARARAYPTRTCGTVHRVRGRVYREEDAAYLPSRSTSLSQRNCPGRRGRSPVSSFPGRETGWKGNRKDQRLAGTWRRKEWGRRGKTVHYRTRKKTIHEDV